jgi:LysR family transcriptional regulator, benzoate and cis,cis-muconate-responsive activator of ben and cat genes
MDLRHLTAFVAVAEEGTFTRAARRLHISQPPLSRHVRQLEKELGVTLFLRRRDGIELTNDGYALLEKAQAAIAAVRNFEGAAHERTSQGRSLCIGIGWGLWGAVDRIRARHAKRFPDMRISAQDLCTERSRIQEREIDLAVMRGPIDEAQYDSEPLFEERFVAILGDSHPLANRKTVRLAELVAEPLLMYERCVGPGVYDKTLELIRAAGIQPSVVGTQPPPYAQGAMMLVASRQGYYVGIASPFTQTHRTSGVAVVPLNEPNATLEVRIAWRRDQISGPVREFLTSARDVFHPKRQPRPRAVDRAS